MAMQKPSVLLRGIVYIGLFPLSFVTYHSIALAATLNTSECPIPLSYTRSNTHQQLDNLVSSFTTNPITGLHQCQAVSVPAGTILNRYYSTPTPDPLNPTAATSVNPGQFLTPNLFETTSEAIAQLALAPAFNNTANFRSTGLFNQDVIAFVGIVGPQGLGYPGGGTQYVVPSNFSFPQNNGILFTYVDTLAVPEPSNILGAVASLGISVGIKRKLALKARKMPNNV